MSAILTDDFADIFGYSDCFSIFLKQYAKAPKVSAVHAASYLTGLLQSATRELALSWPEKTVVETPSDPTHGDLATNLALALAKEARCKPYDLARRLADTLRKIGTSDIASIETAGPGFLNVRFAPAFWRRIVFDIESGGERYGASDLGQGKKTQLEYVSANPTGPLHVGHGRGAAVGDALARILRFTGFDVHTEYYINDAGNQMEALGLSVLLRARELRGLSVQWPEDCYRGKYIADIATDLLRERPELHELPEEEARALCREYGMEKMLRNIKRDLENFRAQKYDVWFSERTLTQSGAVERSLARLRERSFLYEADGALWFASSPFGDDRDRVLRKTDGDLTYFASDIAYHHTKYERGFELAVNVWGADHHGYAPRVRAAVQALGHAPEKLEVLFIQLVNLLRGGVAVSMSKRAGTFETLADVTAETGVDAARFMFLSRKCDSPLDFDLELVRQRNMDNPVYYVQYAHARICALLRRAAEQGVNLPEAVDAVLLEPLQEPDDLALLRYAARFEDVVASAALKFAPHHISAYLTGLAALLHGYYAKHPVLQAKDPASVPARLALLRAMGQVFRNGLNLLGVTAPESM